MADRTSAEIFGTIFEMLAENPTKENIKLAHRLWKQTSNYDFNEYQMDCNKALKKLLLARKGVDPDYPEEGKVWLYGPVKS